MRLCPSLSGTVLGAVLLLAPPLLASGAATARAAGLAAHRALYDLALENARSGDIAGVSGKMAYEVIDACDGWAVRQRLEMHIANHDGQDVQMISDYTTYESKDGLHLRFRMRQTTDTAVTSDVAGDATLEREGGAGSITYTSPKPDTKELPAGTLFPMAHTAAIIAAAEAGKKFMAVPLFDGTSADGAQDSSIAIVGWNPPKATKWPMLSALPSGRVHVAFFDRAVGTQEPDYEVGMRYWENGVADDLDMDFGDFVMKGTMTDFLPQKPNC